MKKKYNIPEMSMIEIQDMQFLANSDVWSDVGIDYGGVNDDGNIIPETRQNSILDNWE